MSETRAEEFGEGSLVAAAARGRALTATAILAGLAAIKLIAQFAGIARYGFFRDELYYMACGQHLAWGYVDQPPLIALVAWFERHAFGNSLVSIRLLPVLTGAAVVFLTGILAREFGAKRFGQFLAASAILWAPAYFAFDSFLSMNAFEPLFWLLGAWIVVRIVKGASPKWWLAFGAVAGIGLENKHTMLVFGFALVAGLSLAGQWRLLLSKWVLLGGAIALAMFFPNLLWEARHGWPQIEVVRNAQLYKNIPISPLRFLSDQILFLSPIALPVWAGGLAWLFFAPKGKPFRFLGVAYAIVLAVFIVLDGKSYYLLPGVSDTDGGGRRGNRRSRRSKALALVADHAAHATGDRRPGGAAVWRARAAGQRVPALLADIALRQFGEDRARRSGRPASAALRGYVRLGEHRGRRRAGLPRSAGGRPRRMRDLRGELRRGGRIDYYGPALGLPRAISGHNAYFDWGPRQYTGSCVIIFGERSSEYIRYFRDVRLAATITNAHTMPIESSIDVYVCRQPTAPLSVLWPHFKMII